MSCFVRRLTAWLRRYRPRGASTFEPGSYHPLAVERTLATLSEDGYNTVRVFIDPGNIDHAEAGHPHGLGRGVHDNSAIHAPYLDNVADFVTSAARFGMYVQFSLAGMQTAKAVYLSNFVDALNQRIGDDAMSTSSTTDTRSGR